MLHACRTHGIGTLVYTSTPSVTHRATHPVEGGNEIDTPYGTGFKAHYPTTKTVAERAVIAANGPSLATVSLRPRLIWGPGDNQLLPRLVDRARSGRLRFVGGGHNLIDTTFVDNAAQAHLDAFDHLKPGAACAGKAYFISNGEPRPLRDVVNALLAAELCAQLGYAPAQIAAALARFGVIQRRLERVDRGGAVRVVDDYGHNPAKLAAAWAAVSAPGNRVLGVWRPHGYGPLRAMLAPLADAFAAVCRAQDRLWLLPVYDAGGTANRTVHSGELADELQARGVHAAPAATYEELGEQLASAARAGDTILIMGARDPRLPVFAREMAARTAAVKE